MTPIVRESLTEAGLRVVRWLGLVVIATFPLWFLGMIIPADILGMRARSAFPVALPLPDMLVPEYLLAIVAIVFFYARTLFDQRFQAGRASNRRLFFYLVWSLILISLALAVASSLSYTIQTNAVDTDVADSVFRDTKTTLSAALTAVMALTLVSELAIAFRRRN